MHFKTQNHQKRCKTRFTAFAPFPQQHYFRRNPPLTYNISDSIIWSSLSFRSLIVSLKIFDPSTGFYEDSMMLMKTVSFSSCLYMECDVDIESIPTSIPFRNRFLLFQNTSCNCTCIHTHVHTHKQTSKRREHSASHTVLEG